MKKCWADASDRIRSFTCCEFGLLKLCCVCFGFLFGLSAAKKERILSPIAAVLFIVSALALISKFVSPEKADETCGLSD